MLINSGSTIVVFLGDFWLLGLGLSSGCVSNAKIGMHAIQSFVAVFVLPPTGALNDSTIGERTSLADEISAITITPCHGNLVDGAILVVAAYGMVGSSSEDVLLEVLHGVVLGGCLDGTGEVKAAVVHIVGGGDGCKV